MIKQGKGYRFHPTDEEMLLLLRDKAEGKPTSPMMIERDIYGEQGTPWMIFREDDPWQTIVESGKLIKNTKALYVITRLVKISELRTVRIAGCGTWDGQTGRSDIVRGNKRIGFKKIFNFKANKMIDTYGKWIMHEYHLDGDFLKGVCNDYVICRIKWNYSEVCVGGRRLSTSSEVCRVSEVSEVRSPDGVLEVQKTEAANDTFEGCGKRKSDLREVSEVQKTEAISDKFQGLGKRESDIGENPTGKRTCSTTTTTRTTATTNGTSYDNEYFSGGECDDLISLEDIIEGEGLSQGEISRSSDYFESLDMGNIFMEGEDECGKMTGTRGIRMNATSYSTEFVGRNSNHKDRSSMVDFDHHLHIPNNEPARVVDFADRSSFDLDSFVASLKSVM